MGVEIDDLLAQFAIETGHYRDNQDEHSDAEHHSDDGDESNDGKESALRLEVSQGQEQAERQFQIGDTVPANGGVSTDC